MNMMEITNKTIHDKTNKDKIDFLCWFYRELSYDWQFVF
jgi:hypothetical protein